MMVEPLSFVVIPIHWLTAISLVMARFLAIFAWIPFLHSQYLPGMIRIGLALSLSLVVAPAIQTEVRMLAPSAVGIAILMLKEVVLGMILGFLFSLPFRVAEAVGNFMGTQMGLGFISTFNPSANDQTIVLGDLLLKFSIALLFLSKGADLLFEAVYDSFLLWPVLKPLPEFSPAMPRAILQSLDRFMTMMVLYSAPVVITLLFTEIGMGLFTQTAPQLNLFPLTFPVKAAVALFILVLYFSFLSDVIINEFASFSEMLDLVERSFLPADAPQ